MTSIQGYQFKMAAPIASMSVNKNKSSELLALESRGDGMYKFIKFDFSWMVNLIWQELLKAWDRYV